MIQIFVMTFFSLYLIAYGLIALFRKEWIWKLRNVSARIEGKDKLKHDDVIASINRKGNIMGGIALVLGAIGLMINIVLFVLLNRGSAV